MDLYIYYRVRSENAAELCRRVQGAQQRLVREYGIVTGLKRRPEVKEGRQTWMEIYQDVPDGFAAVLERAIDQAGVAALIEGQRNIEYFLDVSPCA